MGMDLLLFQTRKKSTTINVLGPETSRWGGGVPCERVGLEKFAPPLKFVPSPQNPGE